MISKICIRFFEDDCEAMLAHFEENSLAPPKTEKDSELAQIESLIEKYAANGKNEEVIQLWLKIPKFQIEKVPVRVKVCYGNALMCLYNVEKAIGVYQQVIDQMIACDEQITDIVKFRKILADLYTVSGRYQKAIREYKIISGNFANDANLEEWSKIQILFLEKGSDENELIKYKRMLRDYLGFVPERDGYKVAWMADYFLKDFPYSPLVSNIESIKKDCVKRADKWLNGVMGQIYKLKNKQKFREALELIDAIPQDIIGNNNQVFIKKKRDELILKEAIEKELERMAKTHEN